MSMNSNEKVCPNSFHSTCDTLSALFEIVVIHGSTIGPSWGVTSRPLGTHQTQLRWWTYEQLSSESTMCPSEVLNDFQHWKACSQQSSVHCQPLVGIPGILKYLTWTNSLNTPRGHYTNISCPQYIYDIMIYHFQSKTSFQNLNLVAIRCSSF